MSESNSFVGKVRRQLIRTGQLASRKLNATGLEQIYQANYLELASRTDWVTEPPLASPRGGTANYSMLFVLLNLLREESVNRVIEFGVGSSSRLITQWNENDERFSVHIEDDREWLERSVTSSSRRTKIHAQLGPKEVSGEKVDWYQTEAPSAKFQLVVIDGPQAWSGSTRFNRLGAKSWIPEILDDEFAILIDDASRPGEARLAAEIETVLRESGRSVSSANYSAADSQILFATSRFASCLYL